MPPVLIPLEPITLEIRRCLEELHRIAADGNHPDALSANGIRLDAVARRLHGAAATLAAIAKATRTNEALAYQQSINFRSPR